MTDGLGDRVDRLESLVEQQQATIEQQQARIDELEAAAAGPSHPISARRRDVLTAGGLLAVIGLGSSSTSADPSGHLGDSSDPLTTVYTESLAGGLTGGQQIDDLLGSGLTTEDTASGTALRSAFTERDSDGLLEPTESSHVGVDLTEVRTRYLLDSGGNSHLRLQNSGPLNVTQPLDINGTELLDNGVDALRFDGSANMTVPSGNTLAVDGSLTYPTTVVSSDYTTSGDSRIAVETGSGAITVTLGSADAVDGRELTIVDRDGNAAANPITVETESSETINPGAVSSKTVSLDGGMLELEHIAGNWYSSRNAQRETVAADTLQLGAAEPVTGGPLGDSGEWVPLAGYKVSDSSITTTNTGSSFVREEANTQSVFIPLSQLRDMTNVADVGLSWAAYIKGTEGTSETVTVRLGYKFEELPNTEVVADHDTSPELSDIASISGYSVNSRTNMFMKTSAGTGEVEANLTQYLWVKLK